jgi:hypothetical protein
MDALCANESLSCRTPSLAAQSRRVLDGVAWARRQGLVLSDKTGKRMRAYLPVVVIEGGWQAIRTDEWNSPAQSEKPPQGLGEKKQSKGRALARVSVCPGR